MATVTDDIDPYLVLGVQPDATPREIGVAWKRQISLFHPDRNPGFVAEANERAAQLNRAYEILRDPDRRAEWDRNAVRRGENRGERRPPASAESGADHSAMTDREDKRAGFTSAGVHPSDTRHHTGVTACPECLHPNGDRMHYCGRCGADLSPAAEMERGLLARDFRRELDVLVASAEALSSGGSNQTVLANAQRVARRLGPVLKRWAPSRLSRLSWVATALETARLDGGGNTAEAVENALSDLTYNLVQAVARGDQYGGLLTLYANRYNELLRPLPIKTLRAIRQEVDYWSSRY